MRERLICRRDACSTLERAPSLSSLRSFAALVLAPEYALTSRFSIFDFRFSMFPVPSSTLNAQRSTLNAQRSRFNVQLLPQKNAKHAKDAAGIALPGSLSSLRSFAAVVSPATPNLRSTHHAPRSTA